MRRIAWPNQPLHAAQFFFVCRLFLSGVPCLGSLSLG